MTTLTLDSLGGTALRGEVGNQNKGRWLVLAEPDLRALDLHDAPRLEVLDLRACGEQDVLHLQLDQLPSLRDIYLPVLSSGAILHRFNLSMPPTLTVHGRVNEFDADWQAGTLRLRAEGMPWAQLCVLGSHARMHDLALAHCWPKTCPSTDQEAVLSSHSLTVVLSGDSLPARLHLSGKGQWWLADASRVTSLVIDGPRQVHVGEARKLETLTMRSPGRCEVEGADVLEQVQGATQQSREHASEPIPLALRHQRGKQLTLRGAMPSLTLLDGWGYVQLHAPALTSLSLGWAKHLALYQCGKIDKIALPDGLPVDCHGEVPTPLLNQARFFIDESTLKQSLRRLEAGELSLLEGVLNVLSQRYAPQAAFHSLSTLHYLAEKGIDLPALWQCRRTLSAWQRQGGRKRKRLELLDADYARADSLWGWDLPVDRLEEGISADLHLWALCAPESKEARDFRKTLLNDGQKRDQLGYILRAATRENPSSALITLALEILATLYADRAWPQMTLPERQAGAARYLPRLLRVAENHGQRQAVMHAIVELTPWEDVPQQLGVLRGEYPGAGRTLMMVLANQPDRWWRWKLPDDTSRQQRDALRQALTQQALMPAGHPLDALNEAVAPSNNALDIDDYLNMPLNSVR